MKNTWNKVLPNDLLTSESLLFYFTADGEKFNTPTDKSIHARPAKWHTDSNTRSLATRTKTVADCIGCFDASLPSFCVPITSGEKANVGKCGDGIVMGNEECDGGEGCDENCKCEDNFTAHGMPYCKQKIGGIVSEECPIREAMMACSAALKNASCDCECYREIGINCLLRFGCNTDTVPFRLFSTWTPCINRCPNNDYCFDIGI